MITLPYDSRRPFVSGFLTSFMVFGPVFFAALGLQIGQTIGRQSVVPVACEAKQDSVIVHPVRQPRGKVK